MSFEDYSKMRGKADFFCENHRVYFQVEGTGRNDQQQQHLLSKRAWDMALQPIKSLPMNMFMMYMAGNTISIFPIMMVVMMLWRPMKTVMAVNAVFKPLKVWGKYWHKKINITSCKNYKNSKWYDPKSMCCPNIL